MLPPIFLEQLKFWQYFMNCTFKGTHKYDYSEIYSCANDGAVMSRPYFASCPGFGSCNMLLWALIIHLTTSYLSDTTVWPSFVKSAGLLPVDNYSVIDWSFCYRQWLGVPSVLGWFTELMCAAHTVTSVVFYMSHLISTLCSSFPELHVPILLNGLANFLTCTC